MSASADRRRNFPRANSVPAPTWTPALIRTNSLVSVGNPTFSAILGATGSAISTLGPGLRSVLTPSVTKMAEIIGRASQRVTLMGRLYPLESPSQRLARADRLCRTRCYNNDNCTLRRRKPLAGVFRSPAGFSFPARNEFEQLAHGRGFFHEHIEVAEGGVLAPALVAAFRRVLLAMDAKRRIGERVRRALGVLKAFSVRLPDGGGLNVDAVPGPADSGPLAGAGLPSLATLTGGAKTYAERMFAFPRIGSLSDAVAVEALATPAHDEGVAWVDGALARVGDLAVLPVFPPGVRQGGMGRRRRAGSDHPRRRRPLHSPRHPSNMGTVKSFMRRWIPDLAGAARRI